MWLSDRWHDYALLDAGDGMKLERWGEFVLARPEPQAVWPVNAPRCGQMRTRLTTVRPRAAARGRIRRHCPKAGRCAMARICALSSARPGFKHTGLFPGAGGELGLMRARIAKAAGRLCRCSTCLLTPGGATLACAAAGASVVQCGRGQRHCDQAHDNAAQSGLSHAPIRHLVDDASSLCSARAPRPHTTASDGPAPRMGAAGWADV